MRFSNVGWVLAICLALPCVATATELSRASEGYLYFHRAGATVAIHDAAVTDCVAVARQMSGASTGIDGLLGASLSEAAKHAEWAANIENCMVADGWDVVRLDDSEGAAIAGRDQQGQAAALAPWIGAPQPHGQIVRSFEPLSEVGLKAGGLVARGHLALSVTAVPAASSPTALAKATPVKPIFDPVMDPGKARGGSAIVVLRLVTIQPPQVGYNFLSFDTADNIAGWYLMGSPVKFLMKQPMEKTFVVVVPPGRWQFAATQTATLCRGSPSFDVGPGDVLFAGTFTAGAKDPFMPDMALDPAKAAIANPELAARLRAASWKNGRRFDCAAIPNKLFPYRAEFSEASSVNANTAPRMP